MSEQMDLDLRRILESYGIKENELNEIIDGALAEDFGNISQKYQKEIRKFKEEEMKLHDPYRILEVKYERDEYYPLWCNNIYFQSLQSLPVSFLIA